MHKFQIQFYTTTDEDSNGCCGPFENDASFDDIEDAETYAQAVYHNKKRYRDISIWIVPEPIHIKSVII